MNTHTHTKEREKSKFCSNSMSHRKKIVEFSVHYKNNSRSRIQLEIRHQESTEHRICATLNNPNVKQVHPEKVPDAFKYRENKHRRREYEEESIDPCPADFKLNVVYKTTNKYNRYTVKVWLTNKDIKYGNSKRKLECVICYLCNILTSVIRRF